MVWQSFNLFQIDISNLIMYFDSVYYSSLYLYSWVIYLSNNFLHELYTLQWSSNLLYHWFHPYRLDNLYNYLIADEIAYIWLWKNGNLFELFTWSSYNLFFQLEQELYYIISNIKVIKIQLFTSYISTAYFTIILSIFKYSFFFIFFLNILFFTRNTLKRLTWINNIIFSKFFIFFETEEEIGSIDDALFFISLFTLLFSWYFLTSLFFTNSNYTGLSFLTTGFIVLVAFVLCIPFSVLVNFGLVFSTYIRGAGSGTNIIVEILFDLISTLVVFTRFIVQNIRFILIFWAYFELFEWIYNSPYVIMINNIFSLTSEIFLFSLQLNFSNSFFFLSILITGLIGYLYYFIHLLILLFIQLGAYFLISFWLFFFFYTSFYLTKTEKYFFFKKYINV